MTMMNVPDPGRDSDGDYDAASDYWAMEAGQGFWTPEAWHKSPQQMIEEARARNEHDFAQCAAHGGKHSNPAAPPSHMRLL